MVPSYRTRHHRLHRLVAYQEYQIPNNGNGDAFQADGILQRIGELDWANVLQNEWAKFIREATMAQYYRPVGFTVLAKKSPMWGAWVVHMRETIDRPSDAIAIRYSPVYPKIIGNPVKVPSRVRLAPYATNRLNVDGYVGENSDSVMDTMNNVTTIDQKWTKLRTFRVPKCVKTWQWANVRPEGQFSKPTGTLSSYFNTFYEENLRGDYEDVTSSEFFINIQTYVPDRIYFPEFGAGDTDDEPPWEIGRLPYRDGNNDLQYRDWTSKVDAARLQWAQEVTLKYIIYFETIGDVFPFRTS